MIDGIKIQPCHPNLVQGRDAIIQADFVNNQGANRCLLFKSFAKRGLGASATGDKFVNSFDIPKDCQ